MSLTTGSAATIDANRALVHAFFTAQDRLRGGPDESLCTSSYRAVIGGNPLMDRQGHEAFARGFYAGIPDATHTIEQIIAAEDGVAVRLKLRGTHSGNFFGIPASGQPVDVAAHILLTVANGRVERLAGLFDETTLLRQMGALPGA